MPTSLPGFQQGYILPDYSAGTIGNIAPTAAQLLGAPYDGLPPLADELWRPLSGVRHIVVVLIDALGWNIISRLNAPLLQQATLSAKITSVFPSTTSAALTSVWTGSAPAQHGLVGLHLFFPDQAVMAQMLSLSPTFQRQPAALVDAGLKPQNFLAAASVGQQLSATGIETYAFKQRHLVDTALSKMHDRGLTERFGITTISEMFINARRLLVERQQARVYMQLYWPSIDTLSHGYGPLSDQVLAEADGLLYQLQTQLLEPLADDTRQKTLVILTADHGQMALADDSLVLLDHHPRLKELLLMRPAGGACYAYLYVRQGAVQAAIDYINEEMGAVALAMPAQAALQSGLFGPLPYAPHSERRMADVVMLMRGKLFVPNDALSLLRRFRGMHGGLTADEMQVPWLCWRLAA